MGTYVVTGSASGMGRVTCERLEAAGHRVIGVDLAGSDVTADLGTPTGRRSAAARVAELAGDGLDGAVMAAGLGPGRGRTAAILQVNYAGVVELLEAWRPLLAATGRAKVVAFGSNSATVVPLVPRRAVSALLSGDDSRALTSVRRTGRAAPTMAYAASKVALARWVRRTAVTADWAGAGIRLNAIAPGAVLTPLLERQLASPGEGRRIRAFPVPVGGYGDPGQIADWVVFMLSDAADFLCGSVVVVDGGSDALFRAADWPRPVPARSLVPYLRTMRAQRGVRIPTTPPASR